MELKQYPSGYKIVTHPSLAKVHDNLIWLSQEYYFLRRTHASVALDILAQTFALERSSLTFSIENYGHHIDRNKDEYRELRAQLNVVDSGTVRYEGKPIALLTIHKQELLTREYKIGAVIEIFEARKVAYLDPIDLETIINNKIHP